MDGRAMVVAGLLGAAMATHCYAEAPRCKLVSVAEWPVKFERGLPIVEGAINGKKIGVLLDTGAYASLLTRDAADRLGLTPHGNYESVIGFGGESDLSVVRIDELYVGGAIRNGLRVRVGGERPIKGVDFILGDDFFRNAEVEFHYAEGVVRLFQARECRDAPLAYWDRNAPVVAMEDDYKIVIPVKVNGHEAFALIDSGATSSIVHLSFAAKVGVTPASPGAAPAGCATGLGGGVVREWSAWFDTVALGGEVIRDARLRIADFTPELARITPEVILGTDFLRTHRVLVSRAQRKVYFSYSGGKVFPETKASECRQ